MRTAERIRQFLCEHTSLKIEDRDGWFYAVKEGTDSDAGSMAFRADMDALPIDEAPEDVRTQGDSGTGLTYASANPGVSHKCGHDGHCAALCAFALELDARPVRRTVYLIFQPAEEIGAGGRRCAELIREKKISEVYAFHNLGGYPEGEIVYRRGLTQPASEGLEILFHGKTSHASAPEDGINPAAAIARTILFAQSLSQSLDGSLENSDGLSETSDGLSVKPIDLSEKPGGRLISQIERQNRGMILCTIIGVTVGTGDFGISAGEGSLKLTLRAEYEEEMKTMEAEILTYAAEQAEEAGLRTEHRVSDYFPETRNSEAGIARVQEAAEALGFSTKEMTELWRASEDFGWYLKECSGAMFYIGNGENWPALHTKEYDFNDNLLDVAAAMFLKLTDPG